EGTPYYQKRWNHPMLLALRYLRQVAVTYYHRYGSEAPDDEKLKALLDDKSKAAVEAILADVRRNNAKFESFLQVDKFRHRFNQMLEKIFRSYTNPSAARRLFQIFQVDSTLSPFMKTYVEPYHTMMYKKEWNESDL